MSELATAELKRSLRRFIAFDQATCFVAVAVILAVYLGLHRNGDLLLLALIVGFAGVLMFLACLPLALGRLDHAVLWVSCGNWVAAVGSTAIATFCLPITLIAAILPAILAVPYVPVRMLGRVSRISLCVSAFTVGLGTLQDFSGLTGELPPWLPPAILVAFLPFIAGLVVTVGFHNSARLGSALTSALGANRRLRVSEAELRRSRNRVVAAADRERRRIEQDLHDGAQQHLLALALELQRAQRLIHRDTDATATLLLRLGDNAAGMIRELADLINGVYPPVLRDRGLAEALIEAAAHLPIRCHLDIASLPRYAPEVEESIYWCCIEALQNIAKHAGADAESRLKLARTEEGLVFEVVDAGNGFDPVTVGKGGHGLTNMTDRIGAVGGELTWWSAPGLGVRVHGTVPAAPRTTQHLEQVPRSRGKHVEVTEHHAHALLVGD